MANVPLGQIVATPGAIALLETHAVSPAMLLTRHQAGDWGAICPEDDGLNDRALATGERLLSVYPVGGEKVWIITEWDRSVTTLLLPEEY
jgi:hypothetical protein